MSWAMERRLDFIDWVLVCAGTLRRADIVAQFDVTTPQASLDIRSFLARYPEAMRHNPSRKCYVAAQPYAPRRGAPSGFHWGAKETSMDPNHVAAATPADAKNPHRIAQTREELKAVEHLRAVTEMFITAPTPYARREMNHVMDHYLEKWMDGRERA